MKNLQSLREKKSSQLIIGLAIGIAFGFFLQMGGVTQYDVIIGQLLLTDFTVIKVMLSAVVTGMIGIFAMLSMKLVSLHPKPGSIGSTVIGGLIFGAGFGVLGYCPGTVSGAVGQGSLDALFGGVLGILIGAGIFAAIYPLLQEKILSWGTFKHETLPDLFGVNPWVVVVPMLLIIIAALFGLETLGL